MTFDKIILPDKLIEITNKYLGLFILLNKVKSKLPNFLSDFINLFDTSIFEIIDVNMITEKIDVIKEFLFSFLERSVHQQSNQFCDDFKIICKTHQFVEQRKIFIIIIVKIIVFVQKLNYLQKLHQPDITLYFLLLRDSGFLWL